MNYDEDCQENERLRNLRQQLINELVKMPQDDPNAPKFAEDLRALNRLLRQKLFDRAMAVCSDPDCIESGTITVSGQQWCAFHCSVSRSA